MFVCVSFSLSSVSFFFDLFALVAVADVGVWVVDPVSRNDVVMGVGACDAAGVDPTDAGADESYSHKSGQP